MTAAGKFRMDRPWADLLVRVGKNKRSKDISLLVVGFATDKAKNIDVWERTIDLPVMHEGVALLVAQWQKESWKVKR
jgi:hypothetical protein